MLPFLLPLLAHAAGAAAPAAAAAAPAASPTMGLLKSIIPGVEAMTGGYENLTGPIQQGVKPWDQRLAGLLEMGKGAGQGMQAVGMLPSGQAQPQPQVYPLTQTGIQAPARQLGGSPTESAYDTLKRLLPHIYG